MACKTLFICLALATTAGCNLSANNPPDQTFTSIIRAGNQGDIEKVIAQYSDDAVLLPPGKTAIQGKASIRKHYETIFASSTVNLYEKIDEISETDEMAFIRGSIRGLVTAKSNGITIPVNDKFLMVLTNNHSEWKIRELLWSSNE